MRLTRHVQDGESNREGERSADVCFHTTSGSERATREREQKATISAPYLVPCPGRGEESTEVYTVKEEHGRDWRFCRTEFVLGGKTSSVNSVNQAAQVTAAQVEPNSRMNLYTALQL